MRRIVGLVIVALMLAILSPSPAGAMTAWYPYNFPGGSWAWFYVNPAVVPQWCIGLGGPGDTGRATIWISFLDSQGRQFFYFQDDQPDGNNICSNIPGNAMSVQIGMATIGDGPTGLHKTYGYVFRSENWSTYHPWFLEGSWGQPVVHP